MSHKFLKVKEAVDEALKSTPRASSLVENLNSRLMGLKQQSERKQGIIVNV